MKYEITVREDQYIFAEIMAGGQSRIFRLYGGLAIDRENKILALKGSVDFDATKKAQRVDNLNACDVFVENYDSVIYSIKKFTP